jgi:hypothetical protein
MQGLESKGESQYGCLQKGARPPTPTQTCHIENAGYFTALSCLSIGPSIRFTAMPPPRPYGAHWRRLWASGYQGSPAALAASRGSMAQGREGSALPPIHCDRESALSTRRRFELGASGRVRRSPPRPRLGKSARMPRHAPRRHLGPTATFGEGRGLHKPAVAR